MVTLRHLSLSLSFSHMVFATEACFFGWTNGHRVNKPPSIHSHTRSSLSHCWLTLWSVTLSVSEAFSTSLIILHHHVSYLFACFLVRSISWSSNNIANTDGLKCSWNRIIKQCINIHVFSLPLPPSSQSYPVSRTHDKLPLISLLIREVKFKIRCTSEWKHLHQTDTISGE